MHHYFDISRPTRTSHGTLISGQLLNDRINEEINLHYRAIQNSISRRCDSLLFRQNRNFDFKRSIDQRMCQCTRCLKSGWDYLYWSSCLSQQIHIDNHCRMSFIVKRQWKDNWRPSWEKCFWINFLEHWLKWILQ